MEGVGRTSIGRPWRGWNWNICCEDKCRLQPVLTAVSRNMTQCAASGEKRRPLLSYLRDQKRI